MLGKPSIPNHCRFSVKSICRCVGVKGTDAEHGSRWVNIFFSVEKLLQKLPASSLFSYFHEIVTMFQAEAMSGSEHKMLVQA